MTDLLPRFLTYIARLGIATDTGDRVLLAVSGGVDSIVMWHLFRSANIPCVIAHCNFQLRGIASDEDAAFVAARAEEWGSAVYNKNFETAPYAAEHKVSIQVAARNLRYSWFESLSEALELDTMATAHHLNDHAETGLMNLLRGSGLEGLAGIPLVGTRAGGRLKVCRPLLGFTKNEILEYARKNDIPWREDSSNASDDYTRNFIRHQVMPLLESVQPGFLHTYEKSSGFLAGTAANYQFLLKQFTGFLPVNQGVFQLKTDGIKQLPDPWAATNDLLKPYGFTPEQARQVVTNLDKPGLDIFSESGNRLTVDRNRLLLELAGFAPEMPGLMVNDNDLMVRLPDGGRIFFTPADTTAAFPDGKDAVYVDSNKLLFPLRLRTWQAGDSFQPFGMDGKSRKMQDFLTDLKLSKPEKERTWLLVNGNDEIIWVVGYRLDNRYKIEKSSVNWLKISWLR